MLEANEKRSCWQGSHRRRGNAVLAVTLPPLSLVLGLDLCLALGKSVECVRKKEKEKKKKEKKKGKKREKKRNYILKMYTLHSSVNFIVKYKYGGYSHFWEWLTGLRAPTN